MAYVETDDPSTLPLGFNPDEVAKTCAAGFAFKVASHILENYNVKNATATYIQNIVYDFHTERDVRRICYVLWRKYGISLRLIVNYARQL